MVDAVDLTRGSWRQERRARIGLELPFLRVKVSRREVLRKILAARFVAGTRGRKGERYSCAKGRKEHLDVGWAQKKIRGSSRLWVCQARTPTMD